MGFESMYDYLEADPIIDSQRIAVMGHSVSENFVSTDLEANVRYGYFQ